MKCKLITCGLLIAVVSVVSVQYSLAETGRQSSDFLDRVYHTKDKVFRVETVDSTFLGTAFAINRYGHLMSCAHVVDSYDTVFLAGYIRLSIEGQRDSTEQWCRVRYAATIDTTVSRLDLAILKVNPAAYKIVSFGFLAFEESKSLREGQDVAICAFIRDNFPVPKAFVSKGIISTIRLGYFDSDLKSHVDIVQMDLSISKGTSGGPIFSPETGRVVGMQRAGHFESNSSSQTPYAVALTIDQILAVLDTLQVPYAVR